jgi:uncharacterized protein (TIGR00299 family) protein
MSKRAPETAPSSAAEPHPLRGAHLHLDCASGAAGDMTLGALIDAGVPAEVIRTALDRLGVGGWRLSASVVVKRGIRAVDVKVDTSPGPGHAHEHGHTHAHAHSHDHDHDHAHSHEHGHEHDHPHEHEHGHTHAHAHSHEHGHEHDHAHEHEHTHAHEHGHTHAHEHSHEHEHGHDAHRAYRDIRQMIRDADLDADVIARALDIFDRVARAEARMHQQSIDDVVFHEVGAIDSIVDIVGTAAALSWLAPASVSAVSVAMGHGKLTCAHGILPVPAPAALEILREAGGVLEDGGLPRELCTPTGAAILASAVTQWAPMPRLVPLAVGYGAGDASLPDRANVLRATIGRPAPGAGADAASPGELWRIEANIDDMSAELCEHAADAAFTAGAVDVWWTPIVMKKGRPALLLAALAPETARDAVTAAMLRETTTIGVRFDRVARRVLEREIRQVETRFGRVPIKIARLDGEVVNAAPEYEACRAAARAAGVPLKQVFAEALAAYGRESAPS